VKVSLLRAKKYTQTHCEHSSQKVIMWCAPPEERTGAGPHKSECTRPRMCFALGLRDAGNDARVILPRMHEGHVGGVTT